MCSFRPLSIPPQSSPASANLTSVRLPPDHPALYDAFFRVAFALENVHSQRKAQASGGQLQQVDDNFAKVFRIGGLELGKVFEVTRSAKTEIQAVESQM